MLFQMLSYPVPRASSVIALFAFLSLLCLSLGAAEPDAPVHKAEKSPKADTAWKLYRNETWGFCVSYPSRWYKGDAFEGAGLFVETGAKKFSKPTGEIDVAAESNQHESVESAAALNLANDLQAHLEGMRKFERAERMEVLEQHPIDLPGSSAMFTRDRYYDPLERATWIEEIVFARRNGVLYRLELECRADQMSRFGPVFARVIQTFNPDCSSRLASRGGDSSSVEAASVSR